MFVLLEEHPLQNLRAFVPLLGNELGAFAEVPEDRVRLSERPAVAEDERRNAQCWIEAAEDRGAIGAVDDIHRSAVVRDVEVRKKQPHLVTVARHRAVIEQHRHISDAKYSRLVPDLLTRKVGGFRPDCAAAVRSTRVVARRTSRLIAARAITCFSRPRSLYFSPRRSADTARLNSARLPILRSRAAWLAAVTLRERWNGCLRKPFISEIAKHVFVWVMPR
jgi:hypothetical protein